MVVTGASSGIGAAAARALAATGAAVAVVGRSRARTAEVARDCGATPFVCDFSRLAEVRVLANELRERYGRVDVLANNAGTYGRGDERTEDGHELVEQVNHLAPFLLTNLLLDAFGVGARVLTTSSRLHLAGARRPEGGAVGGRHVAWRRYATTKLENLWFSSELARRLAPRGVAAAAFHPGSVRTRFGQRGGPVALLYRTPLGALVLEPPEVGADTLVWLATAPVGDGWESGGYYARRRPAHASRLAVDPRLARLSWERSEALVGLR